MNNRRAENEERITPPTVLWPRIFLGLASLFTMSVAIAGQQSTLAESDEKVIQYDRSDDLQDPVALLQKAKLRYEPAHGYLKALLDELKVPVLSQNLVFSKTSCQADFTSPQTPRAIYHSGNVYVGWAQGDPRLDIISIDPRKGPIFYTVDQTNSKVALFTREQTCMRCHENPKTFYVPGLMLRSNYTSASGRPLSQVIDFVNGDNSPLDKRWGGWYVTGTHTGDVHLGNAIVSDLSHIPSLDPKQTANVTDLKPFFDTSKYLVPSSDSVALLVLDHTSRMQNLITHAQYEALLAAHEGSSGSWRIPRAGEELLSYMLFCEEAPLHGQVRGTTDFARDFSRQGPRDSHGRSLFEFDLERRVFKYRCSYMIYSAGFEALRKPMKDYLWGRLSVILNGKDTSRAYANLSDEDRKDVLEVLSETKPEFRKWVEAHRS